MAFDARLWREARVGELRAIKTEAKGKICWDCDGEFRSESLGFHHRDPDTKEFGLASLTAGMSVERLRAEIAKCDVLCIRCHTARHTALRRAAKSAEELTARLRALEAQVASLKRTLDTDTPGWYNSGASAAASLFSDAA